MIKGSLSIKQLITVIKLFEEYSLCFYTIVIFEGNKQIS